MRGYSDRELAVAATPKSLMPALHEPLLRVRSLQHGDLEVGWGRHYVEAEGMGQAGSHTPRHSWGSQPCRACVAARTSGLRTREPLVLLKYLYFKPSAGTAFSRRV